ncbi:MULTISPECIES: GNAT family N-acetyltransferase [Hydrocarboniphaga]|jgi:GNAT superfamily N-acetyltransferase|uniref:GNAT family N-acetyltransferase n=1 Tax=Hydrocarboniphaga TaxID=243627 RepID=UPI002AB977A2|nr:GNAT family N-acetyltransferase [Hydrocarboniphaga sp.]MDZ4077234.1 GNAT family N-acetyltransferase [Hydrocarboniphaga sp.]
MQLIAVTDGAGAVREPEWLARSERVHRQLRPQLVDYAASLSRVFASGGRMLIAVQDDAVLGVAVYRISENTAYGVNLYVDDLVTDEAQRSTGVGHALIEWLEHRARAAGCAMLHLDSGTQRKSAHRFYLRERFEITSFHFNKQL